MIKYGGAAMTDPELREDFARDVVLLKYVGLNPIVVHGGGPDITAYMKRLDMPVEFVGGLRVSDADTVEIAKMVLVGKVNKDIVSRINRHGQPAVGLSGDDGQLFRVSTMAGPGRRGHRLRGQDRARRHRRHQPHRRGLHPGHRVGRRRPRGPLAQRQRRRGGGRDRPRAGRLQGDVPDGRRRAGCAIPPTRTASSPSAARTRSRPRCETMQGGMRPKLQACVDAIHGGVTYAHIIDGRLPHSLLLELFTDAGIGTKVRPAS